MGTPGACGLEAPDATGEVALEGAADVRRLSNLEIASANTPGSTDGSSSSSPSSLSPSPLCLSSAVLVIGEIISEAFLPESVTFGGRARSDMSEFGAEVRSFGERRFADPWDGGGSDMALKGSESSRDRVLQDTLRVSRDSRCLVKDLYTRWRVQVGPPKRTWTC